MKFFILSLASIISLNHNCNFEKNCNVNFNCTSYTLSDSTIENTEDTRTNLAIYNIDSSNEIISLLAPPKDDENNTISDNSVSSNISSSNDISAEKTSPDNSTDYVYEETDTGFLLKDSGYVLGYIAVKSNGDYYLISKNDFEKLFTYPGSVTSSQLVEYIRTIKIQNAADPTAELIAMSIEITNPQEIGASAEFYKVDYEGNEYFMFYSGNVIYRTSKEVYNEWFHLQKQKKAEDTKLYTDYVNSKKSSSSGYGYLNIELKLSDSFVEEGNDQYSESLWVTLSNKAGDEYAFCINPPYYTYCQQLDVGTYYIKDISSDEYPEYPLFYDQPEIVITDSVTVPVGVNVYREQDSLEPESITQEDIEDITGGPIDSTIINNNVSENSTISVSYSNVPTTTKTGRKSSPFTVILCTTILAGCGILYFIKKRR